MGFTQVDSEVATSSLHDYWVSYEKMKAHGSKRHIIIIVAAVTREDDDSGLNHLIPRSQNVCTTMGS